MSQDQDEPILEKETKDNDCHQVFNAKLVGKNISTDYVPGWREYHRHENTIGENISLPSVPFTNLD